MTDPDVGRPFYESWQFWWQMLMFVGIVVNGIYSWWATREKVTGRRFAALEKEVAKKRVTDIALKGIDAVREKRCLDHLNKTHKLELSAKGIEVEIKNMPGQKSVDELHGRITDLAKEVSKMDGSVKGLTNQVALISEYIMKEKG